MCPEPPKTPPRPKSSKSLIQTKKKESSSKLRKAEAEEMARIEAEIEARLKKKSMRILHESTTSDYIRPPSKPKSKALPPPTPPRTPFEPMERGKKLVESRPPLSVSRLPTPKSSSKLAFL
jgi:hypothetical protein